MQVGINMHGFTAQDAQALHSKFVRFPVWQDTGHDYRPVIYECQARGINPVIVLDNRSIDYPNMKIAKLARKYPSVRYWQVGNEPDVIDSESSSTLTKPEWQRLARLCARHLQDRYLIGPGLVNDFTWLQDLDISMLHAVAAHIYGAEPWAGYEGPAVPFGPLDLTDMNHYDLPIWITECGGEDGLFDTEVDRAQYHSDLLTALDSWGVVAALPICYSDEMVPGFGLVTLDGHHKPVYATVRDYGTDHSF